MNIQTGLLIFITVLYFLSFTTFIFILLWRSGVVKSQKGDSGSITEDDKEKMLGEEIRPEREDEALTEDSSKAKPKKTSSLVALAPSGYADHLRRSMMYAGSPVNISLDRIITLKIAMAIFIPLFLAPVFFQTASRQAGFLLLIAVIIVSFFIPDVWISSKADRRQKELDISLPDTLDLLTISVEAGLGFDSAIKKVVDNTTGPLSEELFRLQQEIQLGVSRVQAFRNLISRTKAAELRYLVTTIIQADAYGISIAKVLRQQSKELKVKRHQRAEEEAIKAPVKILFPLILCIFPALMIVVLGPAVINIASTLSELG